MEDLLDRIWARVEPTVYITKAEYLAGLEGWTIIPHKVGSLVVGAVLTKGSELHFVTFGETWKLSRVNIRQYLAPVLAREGCVTTKTPKDDTRQQRFNRLIGFTDDGEDEFFLHMKLTKLRHVGD